MLEEEKIDMFMMSHGKYFPEDMLMYIRECLEKIDPKKYTLLLGCEFKEPTSILLVSIFLGTYGIDRFMIGDIGLGLLKLFTLGCCGIMTFIDWIIISKKTKENNFQKLISLI